MLSLSCCFSKNPPISCMHNTLALIPTGFSTVHPPNKLAKILWETFGKEEGR